MVLISIRPFALRKIFLVIAAMVCLSAICLADPVLMVHRYGTSPEQPRPARTVVHGPQQPRGPDNEGGFARLPSLDFSGETAAFTLAEPGNKDLEPLSYPRAVGELGLRNFQTAVNASLFAMPDQD
jgi:hypothetical protein